jgi:hypothetical protein
MNIAGHRKAMNIVGENTQDATSQLALAPRSVHDIKRCDFINTQAICARVLAQTLAYPIISNAIMELFQDKKGDANLYLISAAAFVHLSTAVTFAVVQQRVFMHSQTTRIICVGVVSDDDGVPIICPGADYVRTYMDTDKLVCIEREMSIQPPRQG